LATVWWKSWKWMAITGSLPTLCVSLYAQTPPLYVGVNNNTVAEYNPTTGAAINSSFITGLNNPLGMALSSNILFVVNFNTNTIGEYNASAGAAINNSLITGLNNHVGIALSGNNLFVTNNSSGTIGEYSASTGAGEALICPFPISARK
jgi:hypothetical protein